MDTPDDSNDHVRVKYDAQTKRVDVFYADRRVTMAGTFENADDALVAAEAYARRYMGMKRPRGTAMDDWQSKYEWKRTWPGETGVDGEPSEDYSCFDGQYAGRIRLELANLKKGNWHWAGARPKPFHGEPVMPSAGYQATAAQAAKAVEDYWDEVKSTNEKSPAG